METSCRINSAVIHGNDAKLFSKAKVSSLHGECWLLVFCFTYLPITKRILLMKLLILSCFYPCFPVYFSTTSCGNTLLHNKVVSSIDTSAFLPVHSHYLWRNPHCSSFLYGLSKNEYRCIALSSCHPLAHLHRTIFKLPQSAADLADCKWGSSKALASSSLLVYSCSSPANTGGHHLRLCSHCCLQVSFVPI